MKIYIEPKTQQEFYTLPNPWVNKGKQIFGLTEKNCVQFGWTTKDVPTPEPTPIPKTYSGYKIIETLKAHNLWDTYRRKLQQADVYELFMKANVIKEDNPYFIKFIKTVPADVKILLDDCIAEPYY